LETKQEAEENGFRSGRWPSRNLQACDVWAGRKAFLRSSIRVLSLSLGTKNLETHPWILARVFRSHERVVWLYLQNSGGCHFTFGWFMVIGEEHSNVKRWRIAFDPTTEYFQLRHLWVLLPALPLFLWNEGALKSIGNALGHFISLDYLSLAAPERKMGRILVEIDIHEGLPEVLDIEWRGRHIRQRLDYQGIPFRCNWCHCTCHLRRECPGKFFEEKTEDIEVQEDPPAYMDEDASLGTVPSFATARSKHLRSPQVHFQVRSNNFSLLFFILYQSWKRKLSTPPIGSYVQLPRLKG
jgi:hypothetical protein